MDVAFPAMAMANTSMGLPMDSELTQSPMALTFASSGADVGSYYNMFDFRDQVPSPLALSSPLLAEGLEPDFSSGWPFSSPIACAPIDMIERAGSHSSDGSGLSPGVQDTDTNPFNTLGLSVPTQDLDEQLSFLSTQYLTFD